MELARGKTKIIRKGPAEDTVILETLNVLTGGDSAKKRVYRGA